MERAPVEVYNVHEYLKPKLCDLYENDSIFDKFEACWSGDDRFGLWPGRGHRRGTWGAAATRVLGPPCSQLMTGSYNNHFHVFNRQAKRDVMLQASRDAIEGPVHILNPIQVVAGAAGGPWSQSGGGGGCWLGADAVVASLRCLCRGPPHPGAVRHPH